MQISEPQSAVELATTTNPASEERRAQEMKRELWLKLGNESVLLQKNLEFFLFF